VTQEKPAEGSDEHVCGKVQSILIEIDESTKKWEGESPGEFRPGWKTHKSTPCAKKKELQKKGKVQKGQKESGGEGEQAAGPAVKPGKIPFEDGSTAAQKRRKSDKEKNEERDCARWGGGGSLESKKRPGQGSAKSGGRVEKPRKKKKRGHPKGGKKGYSLDRRSGPEEASRRAEGG